MTQPADGYNILVLTGTLTFGIAQGLIPFELEDFRLLRAMQSEPSSLAVLSDSQFKSVDDFTKYMKDNPNGLKVGGHAPGGFHQYMLYQLMKKGGFESGWIPHDASGKVTLGLLGKHLDAAMMTPSTGLAQVKSGEIKLLGVSTDERSAFLPDVPTFKEQGYDIEGGDLARCRGKGGNTRRRRRRHPGCSGQSDRIRGLEEVPDRAVPG